MRLVNKSNMADNAIQRMFEFCAKPLGLKAMTVRVYGTEFCKGSDNWGGSFTSRSEIHIATGERRRTYPFFLDRSPERIVNSRDRWMWSPELQKYIVKPGYVEKYKDGPHMNMLFLSLEEFVLHLFAHELRHQWQRKTRPMKDYTFTARKFGRKSHFRAERDADAYALNRLRAWRKLHAVEVYPEHPDQLNAEQK
jgi:hypothetical protein